MLPWLLRIWRHVPVPLQQLYLRLRYGGFGVGIAALIQDQHGRVLLVRRTYSRDEPWSIPGGWLEHSDEAIDLALERELREETGLRVKVGRVRAVERAGFAIVILVDAELIDDLANFRASAEVSAVAWAGPPEVARLSRFNSRLLQRALSRH